MLTRLKELREKAGISQKKLAESIGVSQQSINKYENHNIEPDIETLIRIADYFSTSIDYLVGHGERDAGSQIISDSEFELLFNYRNLTQKQKNSILLVIENYGLLN